MYSLTKPLSTVVLLMDAIRLKSFEEIIDVVSSLDLGSEDRDNAVVWVLDSSPGSVLTLTASRDFEGTTD